MHFHTFRDLPWAYLRLVFPERTLAFKPLELVRLDLVTTVSLVALGFRWEFIDTPADEALDVFLQDTFVNLAGGAAVSAVVGRIALQWWRALTTYELRLSRLVDERRTTEREVAIRRLAREARRREQRKSSSLGRPS